MKGKAERKIHIALAVLVVAAAATVQAQQKSDAAQENGPGDRKSVV